MRIHKVSLLDGARTARGATVIIDVYRAMTSAAVILAGGARELLFVTDVPSALALRTRGRADLCAGEIDGRRPPDFDFGNSPHELAFADLRDRRIVLSTRAGTAGLEAAAAASRRFGGAFVTLSATVEVLRQTGAGEITLAAMGWSAARRTVEDEACADLLAARLAGTQADTAAALARVRADPESAKFGDPARPWFHAEDREIALDIDRYAFAIEAVPTADGLLAARTVEPRREVGP
jgi:2-phosphosulfolactate phosphatase